jgi:hypothetical protein
VYIAQKEKKSYESSESESRDKGLVDDNRELITDEAKEGKERDET